MLNEILIEGAIRHGFEPVFSVDTTNFFKNKANGTERYLIFKTLSQLAAIDLIHQEILEATPDFLSSEPAFSKNCDLVLIHQVDELSDYKKIEKIILSYEEDPYHFKKYFLYYTDAENRLLRNKSYQDFVNVIPEKLEFAQYKTDPLRPSFYSVAARVFIKLPFLDVPRSMQELVPLADEVKSVVAEKDMEQLYKKICEARLEADALESLVSELINEQLENIKAADSGL